MDAREQMPLLARHEGEWKGNYTYVDPGGNVIARHTCHLTHEFPGEPNYLQTNRYTHPDGREETIVFPGTIHDGKLWFDTERIDGHAWEADEKTIILTWVYKSDPTTYLYEMINIDAAAKHRTRTWHWFKDGVCFQRTLIAEERVS